eukprot:PLAT10766.1.p1 GENE.PLAT10766.1~~PLAT10766.1.p1  ORF type:complete len:287 (+),score=87.65 PLAT10766.1:572-1432(+)
MSAPPPPPPLPPPVAAKPLALDEHGRAGGIGSQVDRVLADVFETAEDAAVTDEDDAVVAAVEAAEALAASGDRPATRLCDRCEKDIAEWDFESHRNSHSSEVLPWLFLGGERNANNLKELTVRTGCAYVLNAAAESINYFPERFTYLNASLWDDEGQSLAEQLPESLDFLRMVRDGGKGNVLVHCVQGISRSATIVIAFLMQDMKWPLRRAWAHVKSIRSIIRPNRGFMRQLQELDSSLFGEVSLPFEDVFPKDEVLLLAGSSAAAARAAVGGEAAGEAGAEGGDL